jgi:hypothetical protein
VIESDSYRADRSSPSQPLQHSPAHDNATNPHGNQSVQQQSGVLPSITSPLRYAHETLLANVDHVQEESPSSPGVAESVLRTVVSTGNDALSILFEAATQERNTTLDGPSPPLNGAMLQQPSPSTATPTNFQAGIPTPGSDVLKVWETCRFVTMGWLTPRDAVTYTDL